jgi:hypothetical protein
MYGKDFGDPDDLVEKREKKRGKLAIPLRGNGVFVT